ncbi:Alpha-acetolactate decarboxylase [Picochlorum sp. SENEW3]|nr:Alpha-acetolactate decarboxylase [Picochlorum sp. SENEW3]
MKLTLDLPETLHRPLVLASHSAGISPEEYAITCIERVLRPSSVHIPQEGDKPSSEQTLFVSAPILDLVEGLLSGTITVGEVLQHGDFGLGTLSMLNGEVVVIDGVAYQQTEKGECHIIPPESTSPFMMVCTFSDEHSVHHTIHDVGWSDLHSALDQWLSSKNLFAAIKIKGSFSYVKVRAVRKQEHNRPLVEVTREQAIMEFHNDQEGWLVGFWSPGFLGHALSVPGYHLHFMTADYSKGGHVLDLKMDEGSVYIQTLHTLVQEFPTTSEFTTSKFESNKYASSQLKEAES